MSTMTPKKIERDIRNFLDLLVKHDIAVVANPVDVRQIETRTRLTWKSAISGSITGVGPYGSIENYRSLVERQAYSAVLLDGALLQVSYDFGGSELVGHRLGFHPCPFDLPSEEVRSEPLLDLIDLYQGAGCDHVRLRSPIRCRCPIVAPLGLGHFVHFVFSHFYPEVWAVHDFLQAWPLSLWDRTITQVEEGQLHLACTRP